ncbi:MAG TPA: hypothetical protein VJ063_14200, partial [Verrucomicrobiae bacterium]|nr:hypothetical protein [Verrucomicrobiae bacterium]
MNKWVRKARAGLGGILGSAGALACTLRRLAAISSRQKFVTARAPSPAGEAPALPRRRIRANSRSQLFPRTSIFELLSSTTRRVVNTAKVLYQRRPPEWDLGWSRWDTIAPIDPNRIRRVTIVTDNPVRNSAVGNENPGSSGWKMAIPAAEWLPRYRAEWLRPDLAAGITLAAYLLPAA